MPQRNEIGCVRVGFMIYGFNDNWQFIKEDGTSKAVTLPHDAMLTEKRYAACRNTVQSGYFPGGKYRYVKEFTLTENDVQGKAELLFEGVYRNAVVKVNGKAVCENKYGYTEFTADITNAVVSGKNTVEVTVNNSLYPNCRWYSGSGIYRPVWLILSSYLAPKELKVTTLSYSPAVIEVAADEGATISIYFDGELIKRGGAGKYEIPNAKLWSAEHPDLYTCVAEKGGERKEIIFGIRKIEWSAKTGLLVNGAEVLLRGGCIHHDNGVLGACTYPDAEGRRVRILKEQGFNALRISHNPASRALLDACDELGMYVIDEAFDGWYIPKDYHDFSRDFYGEYKKVLHTLAERDYNHPSVIMYSLGNEVTETASEKGIKLCKEMRDLLHECDGTRPVTCGVNVLLDVYVKHGFGVYKDKGQYERKPLPEGKKYKDKKAGSAFFNYWASKLGWLLFKLSKGKTAEKVVRDFAPSVDVVGLNYASSRYDIDAVKYPDRMMVGSETMVADLPYNWGRVKKHKQLIGDFVWSAWDYIGETCMGWTYQSYKGLPLLANQGMIDITGKPLAQMAFMQTVWGLRNKPFIAVRPLDHSGETPSKGAWQFTNALDSWEWHGYEGKKTVVEVYAKAYKVSLSLNGKIIGTKQIKNCRANFKVKYRTGTLEAVAYDESGREISRSQLSSGGKDVILNVSADKKILRANGSDLCFVEIEFTDNNGTLKPYIEQQIEIQTLGDCAVLQGFGSALYKTNEVFDKHHHDSYRGRALAVFRATEKTGKVSVTVNSQSVVPVTFEIEVV